MGNDNIRKGTEPSVFFVKSSNGKSEYKVDLNKNTCECPHFMYRCGFSGKDCKHLVAVKKEHSIKKENSLDCDKCRQYIEEHKESDCIDLENMFGEDITLALVKEGFIYEERGMFKILE